MRKTVTLLFAVMVVMAAIAQKGDRPLPKAHELPGSHQKEAVVKAQGIDRTAFALSKKAIRKASATDALVTPPEGATGEQWYMGDGSFYLYTDYGWADYTDKVKTITVIFDGNDVYIQGLAYWFANAWIKGVRDGSTVTFPYSTFVGEDGEGADFLVGTNDNEQACPIVFTYNENAGLLTCETNHIAEAPEDGGMSWFTFYDDLVLSKDAPTPDVEVVAPDNLKTESWVFTAVDLSYDNNDNPLYEDVSFNVLLGFDGNDVYVKGLCTYLPEAWIKGMRDGNKVTFASGQYLGKYFDSYNLYFVGYGDDYFSDVTFTMNDKDNKLTADKWVVINGKKKRWYYYNIYTNSKLLKVVDAAAVPATPSVIKATLASTNSLNLKLKVPLFDVDSVGLLSSKLYYKLYTEVGSTVSEYECSTDDYTEIEQNMIEIPYNFTDDWDIYPGGSTIYVYGNVKSWRRVGVQSIYYGSGETNTSDISWFLFPCDLYVAGSFTEPVWEEGKQQMEQGMDNKYTIDVELPENAEFKLLDSKNNWFGGVTDGNNFIITEEQITNGTELSLSIPGMNFVMPFAGKYTITADLDNMKLVVAMAKPCAPTAITLNVTDDDEVAILPNSTFQLSVVSVEPEGANTEVTWTSSDEQIAIVSEDGLVTGMEFDGLTINTGQNRIPTDNDDYDYFPVVITATTTSEMDIPTSASVQIWVKSSTNFVSAINDVKVTSIECVKYVNAQGIVSSTPFNGVNIKVSKLSDGTTKAEKMVK
ncbi:MAG: Ig-like domain-containing protein [Muribaculaceae bacterium]|nr:Ig-like domain-containing protein [Muribaculaceae bacterium]